MKIIKIVLVLVFLVFSFYFLFKYFAWRDKAIEISSTKYEQCVRNQFGISPANLRLKLGYYVSCKEK